MENQEQITLSEEYSLAKAKQEIQLLSTPAGQLAKQFEVQQRMAKMFSISTIVPETFRNNIGNCVIALDMAQRMCVNPLMVMQNLYIVHGQPSFSSKFLIATINASGRFSPLRFEFKGDENNPTACRCIAYEANDKGHKEPLVGEWITTEMAKAEGWTSKAGSKWKTMPTQMMRYRAAAFWQRTYCPEISMGFLTREEVEDIPFEEVPRTHTNRKPKYTELINNIIETETQDEPNNTTENTELVS